MNAYNIKINGKWFVGLGEENGQSYGGGWYDTGKTTRHFILSDEQDKALLVEGNINLKSYFTKIYDSVRYGRPKYDLEELTFVKVGEC